ncbi:MAG: M15 family metallopeptidase [Lachnospiraceae bacterium]|nr:M15 family metallopeptidase [Lachnospiraceae bacterium]
MNNSSWKNLIRPGLAMLLVVIGCGVTARFLSGAETLSDYAEKNPELAYGQNAKEETAEAPSPAPDDADQSADAAASLSANKGTDDTVTSAGESRAETAASADTGASDAGSAASEGSPSDSLTDDSDVIDARVTYADGFFYEPIPATIFRRMSGNSYPEDCPVPLEDLRYLNIRYIDFNDEEQAGELVCNAAVAADMVEIFHDLYTERYQLESVRLIDDYGGDDDASMMDNNTSCFNYRTVAGSTNLSKHALGLAIDINPFYNPWVNHGKVSPPESVEYADRTKDFPHKIDKEDFCCRCFVNHGFFWGGNWNNPDYQHFQKN